MSQSDIQAGFERLLSHCNPIAADVDLNPHPPLTIEWYAHALEMMEERAHEAETKLEESRGQVNLLREEIRNLKLQLNKENQ